MSSGAFVGSNILAFVLRNFSGSEPAVWPPQARYLLPDGLRQTFDHVRAMAPALLATATRVTGEHMAVSHACDWYHNHLLVAPMSSVFWHAPKKPEKMRMSDHLFQSVHKNKKGTGGRALFAPLQVAIHTIVQ
eukprot:9497921-Pyramimonas_sp.AAC.1